MSSIPLSQNLSFPTQFGKQIISLKNDFFWQKSEKSLGKLY